jgi:hypothetical protein
VSGAFRFGHFWAFFILRTDFHAAPRRMIVNGTVVRRFGIKNALSSRTLSRGLTIRKTAEFH